MFSFDTDSSDDSEQSENDNIEIREEVEKESSFIFSKSKLKNFTPTTWKECMKLENALSGSNSLNGSYDYGGSDGFRMGSAISSMLGSGSSGFKISSLDKGLEDSFEDPLGLVKNNPPGLEDFYREKFNPKKFLATVHHDIEYEKLVNGHHLVEKDEFRHRQMQGLVEENLNGFVKTKSTVADLHERNLIRLDHSESLTKAFIALQHDSKDLFGAMIQRKKKTEAIKEILKIISKYQNVIFIPSIIAQNIEKCDYNQVIHDYKKSRNTQEFFKENSSESQIFSPIFAKVEQQIADLRKILLDKLIQNQDTLKLSSKADPNISLLEDDIVEIPLLDEERERIIAYLLNLDSPDPAWYYLNQIHSFIIRYMESTSKKYIERIKAIQIAYLIKNNRSEKLKKMKQQRMTPQELRSIKKLNSTIENECFKLVRSLEKIMIYYLKSFWTLSQNIINNKYKPDETNIETSIEESSDMSRLQLSLFSKIDPAEKEKQAAKLLQERKEEYEEKITILFKSIIDTYSNNCDIALNEIDNEEVHHYSKCKCVKSIVNCRFVLEDKIGIQRKYLSPLKKYAFTQHKIIIADVWERCITAIRNYKQEENWKQVSEAFQITHTPLKFYNLIRNTIELMRPFMDLKSKNNSKSPFFGLILTNFCECLTEFSETLHDLAFDVSKVDSKKVSDDDSSESDEEFTPIRPHFHNSFSIEIDTSSTQSRREALKEQQLIIVLRNIIHTKNFIIPQLICHLFTLDSTFETLKKDVEYFRISKQNSDIEIIYDGLTTLVLNAYTRRKTIHLYKFIEQSMENTVTYQPSGLRTYALELLLELSLIHSRFESIASGFINIESITMPTFFGIEMDEIYKKDASVNRLNRDETLTSRIFESLCERLSELFIELLIELNRDYLTENEAFQFVIEISFIRNTLKKYENERAEKIYNRIFELIEQLSPYDSRNSKNVKLMKEILKEVTSKTRLQLETLRS